MFYALSILTVCLLPSHSDTEVCKDGRTCTVIYRYADPCVLWLCDVCDWERFDYCPSEVSAPRSHCPTASCKQDPAPHHSWVVGIVSGAGVILCILIAGISWAFRGRLSNFFSSLRSRRLVANDAIDVGSANDESENDTESESTESTEEVSRESDRGLSRERVFHVFSNYFSRQASGTVEEREPIVRWSFTSRRGEAAANAVHIEMNAMNISNENFRE